MTHPVLSPILPRDYYDRPATVVARDLLGAVLVRLVDDQRVSGRIVETEAYTTVNDSASHWWNGRTARNRPLWEEPGYAYVYLIYGRYLLLNVVCEPFGQPAGVLIRAIEPLEGEPFMAAQRIGQPRHAWTNGPGRLTLALNVLAAHNTVDMTTPAGGLWIEAGEPVPESQVSTGPRVGLGRRVQEPWLSMPWRWWVTGNPFVSK